MNEFLIAACVALLALCMRRLGAKDFYSSGYSAAHLLSDWQRVSPWGEE